MNIFAQRSMAAQCETMWTIWWKLEGFLSIPDTDSWNKILGVLCPIIPLLDSQAKNMLKIKTWQYMQLFFNMLFWFFFSELRLLYTSPYFDSYMDNTRILCIHFSLNEVLNIIAEFITLWHLKKGYSWQERSRFTNILHFYLSQCFNLLCSARRTND